MHTVQILSSIGSEAAGPSYSVRRLAETLAARGNRSELFTTGATSTSQDGMAGVQTFAAQYQSVPVLRELRASDGLRRALDSAAFNGAVLHSHGLWLMPNLYPAWAAKRHRTPLIVSPRGMISPPARRYSRWRKELAWVAAQKRALSGAACLHATSHQEAQEIRDMGLLAPIAVIPNGIDVPDLDDVSKGRLAARGPRTVLHLGRIHPKKGIDRLVAAWAVVERANPKWRLRIVGPSENGYGEALQRQAASLGLQRVTFEPALFGDQKDAAYRQADIYVLPTLSENFGMVVAEALANGTAVICTKGAPWEALMSQGCGWWIDHGVEPLAAALGAAMAMPLDTLNTMGDRGRAWMARDFSWTQVAAEMEAVYEWCVGAAKRPSVVSTI